jgi:hypothetical protein
MNKKNPKIMLVMDRIQDPGSEIRDPRSGIRDPGSGIRDPGSGIRDPGSGIRDPGSGILKKLIPDRGVKKASDPGSTTLKNITSSFTPDDASSYPVDGGKTPFLI